MKNRLEQDVYHRHDVIVEDRKIALFFGQKYAGKT